MFCKLHDLPVYTLTRGRKSKNATSPVPTPVSKSEFVEAVREKFPDASTDNVHSLFENREKVVLGALYQRCMAEVLGDGRFRRACSNNLIYFNDLLLALLASCVLSPRQFLELLKTGSQALEPSYYNGLVHRLYIPDIKTDPDDVFMRGKTKFSKQRSRMFDIGTGLSRSDYIFTMVKSSLSL